MDKYEIRRQKLLALMREYCGGKAAELAERLGMSASYASRMLAPEGKAAKKNIGEDMVERIEKAFNLSKGTIDGVGRIDEQGRNADGFVEDENAARAIKNAMGVRVKNIPDTIPVRAVKLTLQAGVNGFTAEPDYDIDHGFFEVPKWVIEQLHLNPVDLLIMSIVGRSMEPMLFEGDKILIDTSKRIPMNNEVFAVNWDGEPVVKCLIKKADSWNLYSFNRKFSTIDVRTGQCTIIGLVVWQPDRILTGRLSA